MNPTVIDLGGLEPSQTTVSQPGAYTVFVSLLADNPEVTFSGPGNYTLTSVVSALTATTFTATNGANVTIDGLAGLGSTSNLVVSGNSTITLMPSIGADNPVNAQFSGGGGTLTLEAGFLSLQASPPVVQGFGPSDHIDFGGSVAPTDKIVYIQDVPNTGGTLTLETSAGAPIGSVDLIGAYNANNFILGTAGIDFACFLRGTRILTTTGERAVETLVAGDLVMTQDKGPVPVVAIRRRSFDAAAAAAEEVRPVRIAASALAEGLPHADLYVSPDHSMYLDGCFVPARLLLNGRTVTQPQRCEPVEYFHVEVEPHNVIIAEGAASESYLDIGNQSHFGRPGSVALFPAKDPLTWEDACAPLLLGGPLLARIRAKLARIAEQAPAALQRVA